ncbi:MAG TPA: hypothetical protein VHY76_07895 [Acetobacteraceae bacterium]|nr:hypothetical protein [Acetobacteraceae bacterium]
MPSSSLRQPSLTVLANGARVAGVTSARVSTNNHFTAGSFSVQAALAAVDPNFWSDSTDILLEVRMGLGGIEQSMMIGQVDTVEMEPIRGVMRVTGRDLAAQMIAARTQESFQNQTASQVAETIAGRHGLASSVTATRTPIGRYYQIEHDKITLDRFHNATTEWDLLVLLARQEGFNLFVNNATLHFGQPQAGAARLVLVPSDLLSLHMERALTLAGEIKLTVKSWNSRQMSSCTSTASSGSGGIVQELVIVRPNLKQSEADQLAQTLLAELAAHQRTVAFTMPGEFTLAAQGTVALQGTGSAFDGTYNVLELERSLSVTQGFIQRVRAKATT